MPRSIVPPSPAARRPARLQTIPDTMLSPNDNMHDELRKCSPLVLMGYTTGNKGKLKRERRRILRVVFKTDLLKHLEPLEYAQSGAEKWGDPETLGRLRAIFNHLACWVNLRESLGQMDAARHLREDLIYLIDDVCPQFEWNWEGSLWYHSVSLRPEDEQK